MSLITLITIIVGIQFVLIILVFIFLQLNKRKQQHRFESDWLIFQNSIKKDDIDNINKYGMHVIWNNERVQLHHKQKVLEEISKRKDKHPELITLWKDVFYLVNSKDPI